MCFFTGNPIPDVSCVDKWLAKGEIRDFRKRIGHYGRERSFKEKQQLMLELTKFRANAEVGHLIFEKCTFFRQQD